jgi:hypothetical protein
MEPASTEDAVQDLFLAGWQVREDEKDVGLAKNRMVYGPEKHIQENKVYESDKLRFMPLGYNAWDLAKTFAERINRPALDILVWDGTKCFNYDHNKQFSGYLKELNIEHEFLSIPEVSHTATGSYDVRGDDIMRHHQKTFDKHRP